MTCCTCCSGPCRRTNASVERVSFGSDVQPVTAVSCVVHEAKSTTAKKGGKRLCTPQLCRVGLMSAMGGKKTLDDLTVRQHLWHTHGWVRVFTPPQQEVPSVLLMGVSQPAELLPVSTVGFDKCVER